MNKEALYDNFTINELNILVDIFCDKNINMGSKSEDEIKNELICLIEERSNNIIVTLDPSEYNYKLLIKFLKSQNNIFTIIMKNKNVLDQIKHLHINNLYISESEIERDDLNSVKKIDFVMISNSKFIDNSLLLDNIDHIDISNIDSSIEIKIKDCDILKLSGEKIVDIELDIDKVGSLIVDNCDIEFKHLDISISTLRLFNANIKNYYGKVIDFNGINIENLILEKFNVDSIDVRNSSIKSIKMESGVAKKIFIDYDLSKYKNNDSYNIFFNDIFGLEETNIPLNDLNNLMVNNRINANIQHIKNIKMDNISDRDRYYVIKYIKNFKEYIENHQDIYNDISI